jgi:alpha-tubulin suppressor-like RCC1 family protein
MYHSMALMSDGTVWAWGWNEYGQLGSGNVLDSLVPAMVKNVSGVVDVSGGMHHSLALKSDGKVLAWGRNDSGQLGMREISQATLPVLLEGLDGVKALRAGAYHSAALKSDGTLWIWGWDYAGKQKDYRPRQSGGMAGITAVSAGMHFTSVIREE